MQIGKRTTLLLGAVLATGATQVVAAPISDLYNTGVGAGGTGPVGSGVLPDGTLNDPHYGLVSVPPPDSSNPTSTTVTRVRTSAGGFPIGPWLGDDAYSAWIGPNNKADLSGPVGTYDYQTTFTIPANVDLSAASIVGQWATDNTGTDILINGKLTGNTASGFNSFALFNITSGFQVGVNTLDFIVSNAAPPGDNPTGLRVEITSSATPEPGSLAVLALGGLGLLGRRRRA